VVVKASLLGPSPAWRLAADSPLVHDTLPTWIGLGEKAVKSSRRSPVAPNLASQQMAQDVGTSEARRQASGEALTSREGQVLEMISRGLTNVEIADRLGVTVHAVKFHLHGVYRKLEVQNRTAAAVLYTRGAGADRE
jgi:DNA-binding NarL/FixJ family response regulator